MHEDNERVDSIQNCVEFFNDTSANILTHMNENKIWFIQGLNK